MKRYSALDVCRVFCAILVVVLHCMEIQEGHPIAHMIVRCFSSQAVPFFFILSGFFFSEKIHKASNQLNFAMQYARKQLLLYCAWALIFLPEVIKLYAQMYEGRSAVYQMALIVRRLFFAGQGVYWYLLALAESILVAGVLIRFNKKGILYGTAAIGLALGLLYNMEISVSFLGTIREAFYLVFSWSNNFIMMGVPYVAIGIWLERNHKKITISRKLLVIAYLMIGLVNMVFFGVIYRNHLHLERYMVLYPLQAVLLFLIALRSEKFELSEKTCAALRNFSSIVYFSHTIFIYYVVDVVWSAYAPILLKFSVAMVLATILFWVVQKTRPKAVCWLFSMKV